MLRLSLQEICIFAVNPRARLDNFQEALGANFWKNVPGASIRPTVLSVTYLTVPTSWGVVADLIKSLKQHLPFYQFIAMNLWGNVFKTPDALRTAFKNRLSAGRGRTGIKDGKCLVTGCGFDTNTDTKTPEGSAFPANWVDGRSDSCRSLYAAG